MKLLLTNAQGKKTDQVPMWLMRQAGRYLPEYLAYRKNYPTLTMFQTPKIAADVTLQPIVRYPKLDGAILYADILLIPDALGCGLHFVEGEGPRFQNPFQTIDDCHRVEKIIENRDEFLNRLSYVFETLTLVKPQLPEHVTMLGFAGAPFTVASYMIEGGGTHGAVPKTKRMMFENPSLFHKLMDLITAATVHYLDTQIAAGAEVLQIFESWSGSLSANQYDIFCVPYVQRIVKAIQEKNIPAILFLGEGAHLLSHVPKIKPNVYSVDWRQDMQNVVDTLQGEQLCFQGNLDPAALQHWSPGSEDSVRKLKKIYAQNDNPFICNLGHGISRFTDVGNVQKFIEIIKDKESQLPSN